MYIVYSDGEPIYSPNLIQHDYILLGGKITMELNKSGSFDFTLPKVNPAYSTISKLKSTITVEEDGEEIWRGRILEETRDFYNNKKVVCEGELAFLNDVLVPSYDYSSGTTLSTYFNFLMNRYSSNCSSYRMIRAGNISMEDSNQKIYPKLEGYSDILTELTKNVVDALGGYLITRRESGVTYLDYYENIDRTVDQIIQFGKNMVDFQEYINAAEVYTYLIPTGKTSNGKDVNITSVNSGLNYIHSENGENLFGKIWKNLTWENVSNASNLLSLARKELDKGIEMATTITINAVDLSNLGVDVSKIKFGYQVPVVSLPHEVNSNFLCSKLTINLDDPSQNEYGLGLNFSALTDQQAKTSKNANAANKEATYASSQSGNVKIDLDSYKETTDLQIQSLDQRIKILEGGITNA